MLYLRRFFIFSSLVWSGVSFGETKLSSYACTDKDMTVAVSMTFYRDSNWREVDPCESESTKERPSFSTTALIEIGSESFQGTVSGYLIEGQTRLTGYTQLMVSAPQADLNLSLVEDPDERSCFGNGPYKNKTLLVRCLPKTPSVHGTK